MLPATSEGPACGLRDADNHQGPAAETAPGMEVASTVDEPYDGYTVEVAIPMSELPGAVDPEHMGLNVFVYDSDTQDKTGQTRLGWSTWGGVQGDPYRWGVTTLQGYQPPADRPTEAPEPIIPRRRSPRSTARRRSSRPCASTSRSPVTRRAPPGGPDGSSRPRER